MSLEGERKCGKPWALSAAAPVCSKHLWTWGPGANKLGQGETAARVRSWGWGAVMTEGEWTSKEKAGQVRSSHPILPGPCGGR